VFYCLLHFLPHDIPHLGLSHRPLVSIQLCLMMPPPSSSSCIPDAAVRVPGILRSPSSSSPCGVLSAVVPAWRCCRHFSVCPTVQASSTFFFLVAPTLALHHEVPLSDIPRSPCMFVIIRRHLLINRPIIVTCLASFA